MKTIRIKVEISNAKDMNELVDKICELRQEDKVALRDRFKMVTQANSKTLNDLCKHLKLKLTFDYSGTKNLAYVDIDVNNAFKTEKLKNELSGDTKQNIPASEDDSLFESTKSKDGNGIEDGSEEEEEDNPF